MLTDKTLYNNNTLIIKLNHNFMFKAAAGRSSLLIMKKVEKSHPVLHDLLEKFPIFKCSFSYLGTVIPTDMSIDCMMLVGQY